MIEHKGIVYVTSEINKLVKSGQYLGGINASLKQKEVWHYGAEWEPAPVREGQDFKIYEDEPPKPKQQPSSVVNKDSTSITDILFSGVEKRHQKNGYYTMFMDRWHDLTSESVNDLAAAFKDTAKRKMEWIGGSASLTRDLQCRRIQLQAYLGGDTHVTLADTTTTEVEVYDVCGFIEVVEAGVPFPVSSSHPLTVIITNGTLGEVTKTVVDVAYDVDDLRIEDDTVPGVLTLGSSIAEVDVGDPIKSEQSSVIVRPGGKSSRWAIDSDDILTFNMISRIAATLPDFGISRHADGFYHFTGDTEHFYQMWQDPTFANAYQGQYRSTEWQEGNQFTVAGIRFDFSNQSPNLENEDGVLVKPFLVTGAGALKQGYYKEDPKQTYSDIASSPLTKEVYDAVNKVRHVIQMPINIWGDTIHFGWEAYWGFAARRDSLAQFGKRPKASHKRGVAGYTA